MPKHFKNFRSFRSNREFLLRNKIKFSDEKITIGPKKKKPGQFKSYKTLRKNYPK